jgi:hypothetical protein
MGVISPAGGGHRFSRYRIHQPVGLAFLAVGLVDEEVGGVDVRVSGGDGVHDQQILYGETLRGGGLPGPHADTGLEVPLVVDRLVVVEVERAEVLGVSITHVAELVADPEILGEVDRVLGIAQLGLAVSVQAGRPRHIEVVAGFFLRQGHLTVVQPGDAVGDVVDLLGDVGLGDASGVGDVGEDGFSVRIIHVEMQQRISKSKTSM